MKTILIASMVLIALPAKADEMEPGTMQLLGSTQICRLDAARQYFADQASKETRPALVDAYRRRVAVLGQAISEVKSLIAKASRVQLTCTEPSVKFMLSCVNDPNRPRQCDEPKIAPAVDYLRRADRTILN